MQGIFSELIVVCECGMLVVRWRSSVDSIGLGFKRLSCGLDLMSCLFKDWVEFGVHRHRAET